MCVCVCLTVAVLCFCFLKSGFSFVLECVVPFLMFIVFYTFTFSSLKTFIFLIMFSALLGGGVCVCAVFL